MQVPILYQIVLKRLSDNSFKQKIEMRKVKSILSFYCRVPKNLITPVILEMESLKLIECTTRSQITILKEIKCDILYRHPGTQREYNGTLNTSTGRKLL